ncbi:MAG: PmoA family protein, partial [Gemmataceae bacterium]|nr:PmoA family protein [Gemmataceae bacterium]
MLAMGGFAALLALAAPAPGENPSDGAIVVGKDRIDFMDGKRLVARYLTDPKLPKPVWQPLNPVGDSSITRSWPLEKEGDEDKDHVHHKGLWWCHGDIIPEGMEVPKSGDKRVHGVDFWSEAKNHGRIVFIGADKPKDGRIVTRNEWRTSEGTKIMDETRTLSIHPVAKGHLLVMASEMTASVAPLVFGDTKEGSWGVRVRKTVALKTSGGKGKMVNDKGGSGDAGTWGKVASWCDYSGPLGKGGPVGGVALMAHPSNSLDTAWHARGYGLMAANPFGRAGSGFPDRKGKKDSPKLAKDETLKLVYAAYLHPGDAKEGQVAEAFAAFG